MKKQSLVLVVIAAIVVIAGIFLLLIKIYKKTFQMIKKRLVLSISDHLEIMAGLICMMLADNT